MRRRSTLAVLAALAALAVPTLAPSSAGACANPANVKYFKGRAHMAMSLSATGVDPGLGGSETATLTRKAQELRFTLGDKLISKEGAVFFAGKVHYGQVAVEDSLVHSGSGLEGSYEFKGALGPPPTWGRAEVAMSRKKCRYELVVGWGVVTTFSGDEELAGARGAHASMESGPESIPHSLDITGGGNMDAYLGCDDKLIPQACFSFGGTWTTNFATLALCGSVTAVGCKDDSEPVGTATVGWSLTPVFEKPPKKK
jgi:hypothetical protein